MGTLAFATTCRHKLSDLGLGDTTTYAANMTALQQDRCSMMAFKAAVLPGDALQLSCTAMKLSHALGAARSIAEDCTGVGSPLLAACFGCKQQLVLSAECMAMVRRCCAITAKLEPMPLCEAELWSHH